MPVDLEQTAIALSREPLKHRLNALFDVLPHRLAEDLHACEIQLSHQFPRVLKKTQQILGAGIVRRPDVSHHPPEPVGARS